MPGALVVVTPSANQSLVSEDAVRQQVPACADVNTVSSALLQRWIDQATSLVLQALNRDLAQERVRETFTESGWREFQLSRYPVKTVHSVTVNGQEVAEADYSLIHPGAGLIRIEGGAFAIGGQAYLQAFGAGDWQGIGDWPGDVRGVRQQTVIEYTGGYGLAGSVDTPVLPAAIEFATVDAIRAMVSFVQRDPTVQSMSLGDASWTFKVGSGGSLASAGESLQKGLAGSLSGFRNIAM